jgi:hypothetical protein
MCFSKVMRVLRVKTKKNWQNASLMTTQRAMILEPKDVQFSLVFLKKDSLTFVKTVLTSRAGENRAMPPAMLRPVMYSLCPGISSWILAKPYSMRYTWLSMSMSAITYRPSSANCAPAGRLATQLGKSGTTDCTNARSVDVYTK